MSATLRTVANRLNISTNELPHHVGFLATSLSSCSDVLRNHQASQEVSATVHKLKTRISALLQDRAQDGRLAGIIMVKALVEAGGESFLLESGNWVRQLLSCLNKSDSAHTKSIAVLTISRIYLLSVDNQAATREVTTPTLPAFITTTSNLIKAEGANKNGMTSREAEELTNVVLRTERSTSLK